MRYCLIFATSFLAVLVIGADARGQSVTDQFIPDLNGRLVDARSIAVSKTGEKTELSDSINGRRVPREQVEKRVIRETLDGRVTETITRKLDPDGKVTSIEKVVSEEQRRPDGTTIRATTYRSDLSGNLQESERRTVESVKQGATTTSNVTVQSPDLSGGFRTVEKRKVISVADQNTVREDETVSKPGPNGQFADTEREIRNRRMEPGKTVESTTKFFRDYMGNMALFGQEQTTTVTAADGSETTERYIYGRSTDSPTITDSGTQQQLKQAQTITRRKGPGDTVIEVTTIRDPNPRDPNMLGEPRKISETVCKGKCDEPQK